MIESRTAYGFGARVEVPYDEAVERVKRALQTEGFGVLWEIDVRRILKEKRGVDFRKYLILGACNPPLAHQALAAEIVDLPASKAGEYGFQCEMGMLRGKLVVR